MELILMLIVYLGLEAMFPTDTSKKGKDKQDKDTHNVFITDKFTDLFK